MKKYAQINETTGQIHAIFGVHSDITYPETAQPDGSFFKEIDSSINDSEFKETNYWRNNQWNTRIACPGENYEWINYEWVLNLEPFWAGVRYRRNTLLTNSDWTQIADVSLSSDQVTAWQTYRQDLRNITTTYSSATTDSGITWPTQPS